MKSKFEQFRLWVQLSGLVCVVAATGACGRRVDSDLAQSSASAQAAIEKVPESAQESCGVDHAAPVRDSAERTVTDSKTGRQVTEVGQHLDAAAERTTLAALQKEPEKFVGRTLLVDGEVTAMCTHRRGWYAIVDESSKAPLRIVAVPNFLVPANAMGRRARSSGVLEIQEVSQQAATHLSRDHGLPEARRIVTLRATGAEFR